MTKSHAAQKHKPNCAIQTQPWKCNKYPNCLALCQEVVCDCGFWAMKLPSKLCTCTFPIGNKCEVCQNYEK